MEHPTKDNETLLENSARELDDHKVCCFGMILGLQYKRADTFQVHETPIPLLLSPGSGTLLESTTRNVLGIIDQKGCKILDVLGREISVQLFADTVTPVTRESVANNRRADRRSTRPDLQAPLKLCAVLYGPAALGESVGMFTAECKLYLQHPRHCDRNVPYRNPQCLSKKDDHFINTYDLNHIFNDDSLSFEAPANHIDLFVDTTMPDIFKDTDTPKALSTELYKHQKQALTFMTQRERGWALDGSRKDIWKQERDDSGRIWYHNIISGMKQARPPPQLRGGLLIDAPGLGKSLSILALIASGVEHRRQCDADDEFLSTTLVVVPKTLIQMWKDEIQKHIQSAEALRYHIHYGKDRAKHLDEIKDNMLVITTYSVVRLDWKAWLATPGNPSTLHAIRWGRVVLDEAHIIREPSKSFAASVCALQANKRWAVTATPIQNRLMDLYSLFKFLRCFPFDDFRVFNTQVIHNWKARSDPQCVAKLKTLVNCLSIRRPKVTIELPPRRDDVVYLDFNKRESEDYRRAQESSRSNIAGIETGDRGNDGGILLNTLQWVNELRLICNHGTRKSELRTPEQPISAWSLSEGQARFDQLDGVGLAKCSNTACSQDLSSVTSNEAGAEHDDEPWISESLELWCSLCIDDRTKKATTTFRICNHFPRRSEKLVDNDDENEQPYPTDVPASSDWATAENSKGLPTKVRRLLLDLDETPNGIKSVVFSSWTKTFDIIQPQLRAKSIRCIRLDGSLSATIRANVLRTFRVDPDIRVLLATITCGGVGLDLTAASRAYIMEPQWNPMSETQAVDRIYRWGQQREVKIMRYIIKGSWEEQVLSLQRRKQNLAELTLDGGNVSKDELTYGRLQYLKELVG